jgi:hypothetical protein
MRDRNQKFVEKYPRVYSMNLGSPGKITPRLREMLDNVNFS